MSLLNHQPSLLPHTYQGLGYNPFPHYITHGYYQNFGPFYHYPNNFKSKSRKNENYRARVEFNFYFQPTIKEMRTMIGSIQNSFLQN